MIKQATIMYMLDKRAAGSDVWDSIKGWWNGLSDDDKQSVVAGGLGLAGGSVIGGLAGGTKGAITGGLLGAGGAYAGRKWLYPYLMSQFKPTPKVTPDKEMAKRVLTPVQLGDTNIQMVRIPGINAPTAGQVGAANILRQAQEYQQAQSAREKAEKIRIYNLYRKDLNAVNMMIARGEVDPGFVQTAVDYVGSNEKRYNESAALSAQRGAAFTANQKRKQALSEQHERNEAARLAAQQKRDAWIARESNRLIEEYVRKYTARGRLLTSDDVARLKDMARRQAETNYNQ